jgi:hypothetical protein
MHEGHILPGFQFCSHGEGRGYLLFTSLQVHSDVEEYAEH